MSPDVQRANAVQQAAARRAPPKDVDPETLFARVTMMPRPTKVVPFPRRVPDGEQALGDVAIWVLTESELMRCRASASMYATRLFAQAPELAKGGETGYELVRHNEQMVELLVLACRDPRNPAVSYFPNPELARKYVTSDEFAVLFEAYCLWQAESGPIIAGMTEAEMDEWIDRLAEGASAVPLAQLSSGMRDRLLMRSASRLRKSRTGSGSPGSGPGGSSSSSGSESPSASEPASTSRPLDEELPQPPVVDGEVPAVAG